MEGLNAGDDGGEGGPRGEKNYLDMGGALRGFRGIRKSGVGFLGSAEGRGKKIVLQGVKGFTGIIEGGGEREAENYIPEIKRDRHGASLWRGEKLGIGKKVNT